MTKVSNQFKETIKVYLDQRAKNDALFDLSYHKEGKNIDDCVTYILNTVQKSGCSGFADDEIFSMAVHYYDENHIEVGKSTNCQVIVNHTIELTDEDKAEARAKAMQAEIEKQRKAMTSRPKKTKEVNVLQPSLFDRP